MRRGHKRQRDQNGFLLWWTRLWAHERRGAVSTERSPRAGQVRLLITPQTLCEASRWLSVQLWLTVGLCVQVSDAGPGPAGLGHVRPLGLGPATSSSGCQNCSSDSDCGRHFSRTSRWPRLVRTARCVSQSEQFFFYSHSANVEEETDDGRERKSAYRHFNNSENISENNLKLRKYLLFWDKIGRASCRERV